ncbi:uncharacterized protein L969DRAFT_51579 [Mixia osmundae IAM 14324]|uniref:Uncharacterized protein n=1 Tax=Mixia osmundae (strain CBS 9802 / IAM 14324 / JCM 22182 / KY 12970) TaxID=764103 RepID=G7DSJ2_MIXOS|nr:uncharacterized protein L969DRAFT_51579 [Mixia osmundae IAM 14324]KEI37950.1 hypothetical protein L969DRAFT_51579 [Mixia osmundae IAM 14324]GAA93552.1 hypothetical protein E5Q_00196 [Mixia osmundae IAM 14324]
MSPQPQPTYVQYAQAPMRNPDLEKGNGALQQPSNASHTQIMNALDLQKKLIVASTAILTIVIIIVVAVSVSVSKNNLESDYRNATQASGSDYNS